LTQEQVAEEMDTPQQTISGWITEKRKAAESGEPPASRQHFDVWTFHKATLFSSFRRPPWRWHRLAGSEPNTHRRPRAGLSALDIGRALYNARAQKTNRNDKYRNHAIEQPHSQARGVDNPAPVCYI
jgi:hypothetical protein